MSRTEVAAFYGVDPKAIDRWAKLGRIPSRMTPGGQRKYVRADIETHAKDNGWSEFSSLTDD